VRVRVFCQVEFGYLVLDFQMEVECLVFDLQAKLRCLLFVRKRISGCSARDVENKRQEDRGD
jgi:hypothetical protein